MVSFYDERNLILFLYFKLRKFEVDIPPESSEANLANYEKRVRNLSITPGLRLKKRFHVKMSLNGSPQIPGLVTGYFVKQIKITSPRVMHPIQTLSLFRQEILC